tara:strand:+ start:107 stop:568 length:462 start_codon:yes stop_codon:yes gene_type:complete
MTASKPEVKRWHPENTAFGYNMKPTPDGDFVLFCHHEAARAADKARIAELEDKAEELDRLLKEALMAFDIICPECRSHWLLRHCSDLPITEKDERISAQQWLLEMCQQSLREHGESYCELNAYLRGDIDHDEVLAIKAEHETALAQQGKEGEA